jgi:hypothetical protein
LHKYIAYLHITHSKAYGTVFLPQATHLLQGLVGGPIEFEQLVERECGILGVLGKGSVRVDQVKLSLPSSNALFILLSRYRDERECDMVRIIHLSHLTTQNFISEMPA